MSYFLAKLCKFYTLYTYCFFIYFLCDNFYFIYNLIFCFHISYFHSQNTFFFFGSSLTTSLVYHLQLIIIDVESTLKDVKIPPTHHEPKLSHSCHIPSRFLPPDWIAPRPHEAQY